MRTGGTKPSQRRWRIVVALCRQDHCRRERRVIAATLNFRDHRSAGLGRTVLAASFALVTLAGNDAVGEAFTVWAYRHSVMVLGSLVLLVYFALLVLDELRQEQSAAGLATSV